jgi:hypothetical protein
MTSEEYQHLEAERTFLQGQLTQLPENAQITRLSTQARLRFVEAQIAEVKEESRQPACG